MDSFSGRTSTGDELKIDRQQESKKENSRQDCQLGSCEL